MKHSNTWFASILIVSVLLLSAANGVTSNNADPNQSKKTPAEQTDAAHHQEQQIPISLLQTEQAALDKAIGAIKQQAEAAKQRADTYKETFHSPSVEIQIGLLTVGVLYSIFAALQWVAIGHQAKLTFALERPWLMVIPTRFEIEPKSTIPNLRKSITFFFKVVNIGHSPAWLTGTRGTTLKASPDTLPASPEYPKDIAMVLTPKAPCGTYNDTFEESARRTFEPDEYVALCEGKLDFVIYGIMTYRDPLNTSGFTRRTLKRIGIHARDEHTTRYCFSLTRGDKDAFAMRFCAPPAYNRYT